MPEYKYSAVKINGKKVKGKKSVGNKADLKSYLEGQGLYLIESSEFDSARSKAFKAKQLSEFCRELGMMLGSGVPLIRALNVMIQRDINVKQKEVYTKMHLELQRGFMLSEAMEMQKGVFPELLINMIKSSEKSGSMESTCQRMAEHYEKSYKLKQKVKSAMTYPIILAVITCISVMAIFRFILPKFFEMFEQMDTPLPGITKFMLSLSLAIEEQWMIIIMVTIIIVASLILLFRVPKVKVKLHKMKLGIPIVGKLNRIICTARFARTLSSCYTSGVSMINSLQSARDTIGNKYIESQFDKLINSVRNGDSLSAATSRVDGFDKKLVANILIGEETGRLDTMLEHTANNFDYEAEMALNRMTAIVEPVMIVLMAVIIGTIMISVLLPLPTMYNSVGKLGGM